MELYWFENKQVVFGVPTDDEIFITNWLYAYYQHEYMVISAAVFVLSYLHIDKGTSASSHTKFSINPISYWWESVCILYIVWIVASRRSSGSSTDAKKPSQGRRCVASKPRCVLCSAYIHMQQKDIEKKNIRAV